MSAEVAADDKFNTCDLRQRYLHFMASGLVFIGRVGHQVLQKDASRQDELIRRLTQLDWGREAAMWQGNVVTSGKVNTQNHTVQRAVIEVKTALGLEISILEQDRERRDREKTNECDREVLSVK